MRDSWARGHEVNLPDFRRRSNRTLTEKLKERRPVYAGISPPMASSRLLVIRKIGVKFAQRVAHSPGFTYGDVIISVAVQNVYSKTASVLQQSQRVAWRLPHGLPYLGARLQAQRG